MARKKECLEEKLDINTPENMILQLRTSPQLINDFITAITPKIQKFTYKIFARDSHTHDDVVQEALMAVVRHWEKFDPAKANLDAWLWIISRNISYAKLSSKSHRITSMIHDSNEEVLDKVPASPAEETVCDAEEMAIMRQKMGVALESISPAFKPKSIQAFCETVLENRPVQDVAQRLEMTAGSVYVAKCRVLAALRAKIEKKEKQEQSHCK